MATFQFSNHAIELDFPGDLHWSIELTSEFEKRYKSAAKSLIDKSHNVEDFDEICDCVMDAIDVIIGEDGAADRILGLKSNYTCWDAMDVFQFISNEIDSAIKQISERYNTKSANMNRAQRRAMRTQ